jgi:hypothetical protein
MASSAPDEPVVKLLADGVLEAVPLAYISNGVYPVAAMFFPLFVVILL